MMVVSVCIDFSLRRAIAEDQIAFTVLSSSGLSILCLILCLQLAVGLVS